MRGFGMKWMVGIAVALGMMVAGSLPAAHAVLERVGPVSNAPTIGGYPAWYQDTTGLALEFCDPNPAEAAGGWCLLLGTDVTPPEVFPTNFFDEHFWYSTGAVFPQAAGILWEAAVEAAFANAVQPGGQITFSRIRMRMDPPISGTYRFIHPYGEEIVEATAGERIFITDDVGLDCPPGGPFHCAMASRLGPFLLPSATPGGPEMPPLTALNPTPDTNPAHFPGGTTAYPGTGKSYIADPAREGPVTGSPLGPTRNFVRVEGPAGSNLDGAGNDFIETTNFTLVGRVFTGAIPSQVTVDRASYARPLAGPQKVDVFATAFPATQGRLPAGTPPLVVTPLLRYYDGACGVDPVTGALIAPGGTPTAMASPGLMAPPQAAPASIYWGQSQPALIPAAVCVEHNNAVDANNQIAPVFFQANVNDQVFITAADYSAASGSLSVSASSSDEGTPPVLTVAALGDMTNGQFVLSPLAAPPATVRVLSSFGGSNEFQVSTAVGTATGGVVAAGDTATIAEDSGTTPINVLANDTLPAGIPVLNIVSPPGLGTAVVNGTAIDYTPNLNANGTDGFTYRVTVGAASSNIAAVTIAITPVNDNPVAANDTATAIATVQTSIDVLANDTDPDGQANLAAPVNVTLTGQPPGSIVTLSVSVNVVNFTADLAGTYTFTYQAQDVAGATSNTATVTVTVAGSETVTIQVAEFRTGGREWRVSGVVTPTTSGPVTIRYVNGTNTGCDVDGTATVTIGAGGAWSFREAGVTGCRDPRNTGATRIRATGPSNGTGEANITLRR